MPSRKSRPILINVGIQITNRISGILNESDNAAALIIKIEGKPRVVIIESNGL